MTANARQRERRRRIAAAPINTDDVALDVWAELVKAAHEGASLVELQMVLPAYSGSQISRGLQRINHVLQQSREQPLIVTAIRGRHNVYKLPEHVGEYQEFAMRRVREVLTRIGTEVARGEAAVLRWPDDMPAYIPKMLHRLREDAGYILDDLEALSDD